MVKEELPNSPNLRAYPSDLRRLQKKRIGIEKAGDILKRILTEHEKITEEIELNEKGK